MIENLLLGLETAFSFTNLLYCFLGVLIGTAVGVLPGIGPLPAISILLPLAFNLDDPITGIIFLSGIYYGTQYGGSTTSILLKLPGEISATVTTLDGYAMTKKGRGGAALAVAAMGSFFAGTVATMLIALIGEPLADIAFLFGAPEYTSLMLLGLIGSVCLSTGSILSGLGMVLIGILLGQIGTDIQSGEERYVFDMPELVNGISFGIIAMAMFGLAELLYTILHQPKNKIIVPRLSELYPNREEMKRSMMPVVRGTVLGSILGLLPGGGSIISAFASYAVEKKLRGHKHRFGEGAIEGVAGPESANNAGAQTSFVPMLSLGLPVNPVQAILMAVLIFHNITPGPQVISKNIDLFWGLIVSMWIGNLFLLFLNLPLIGLWTSVLKISRKILYPLIVVFCVVGAYSLRNNWFDVFLILPFTLLGYTFKRFNCEVAPLGMGFVVGTMFEDHLKRALILSEGSLWTFFERPLSLGLILLALLLLVVSSFFKTKKKLT